MNPNDDPKFKTHPGLPQPIIGSRPVDTGAGATGEAVDDAATGALAGQSVAEVVNPD